MIMCNYGMICLIICVSCTLHESMLMNYTSTTKRSVGLVKCRQTTRSRPLLDAPFVNLAFVLECDAYRSAIGIVVTSNQFDRVDGVMCDDVL